MNFHLSRTSYNLGVLRSCDAEKFHGQPLMNKMFEFSRNILHAFVDRFTHFQSQRFRHILTEIVRKKENLLWNPQTVLLITLVPTNGVTHYSDTHKVSYCWVSEWMVWWVGSFSFLHAHCFGYTPFAITDTYQMEFGQCENHVFHGQPKIHAKTVQHIPRGNSNLTLVQDSKRIRSSRKSFPSIPPCRTIKVRLISLSGSCHAKNSLPGRTHEKGRMNCAFNSASSSCNPRRPPLDKQERTGEKRDH